MSLPQIQVSDTFDSWRIKSNTVASAIGDMEILTTDIKTSIVNAVNELDLLKSPIDNPTFTGTVTLPSTTSIGSISSTELGYLNGVTSGIQSQIDNISVGAPAGGVVDNANHLVNMSPTETAEADTIVKRGVNGNIVAGRVTLTSINGTVSSTEIGCLDGVTSGIQNQLNLKAPNASPTFTGTVTLPTGTSIGTVSSTEIGYLDGVTSGIQSQINNLAAGGGGSSAPLASPTFTGTVSAPTPSTGTNTTQVATTAFVNSEIANDVGVANSSLIKTALNATGSAPIYACRAWVNFHASAVSIRAGGNVSSITYHALGEYTVNFTTAMPDVNYAEIISSSVGPDSHEKSAGSAGGTVTRSTTGVKIFTTVGVELVNMYWEEGNPFYEYIYYGPAVVGVAIFR